MVANAEPRPDGSNRSRSTSLSSSDSESRTTRSEIRRSQQLASVRTRSRSRSARSSRNIDRVYSGRHIDDQSVYQSGDEGGYQDPGDPDTDNVQKVGSALEVRGGIVNERDYDLERNAQASAGLEKSRTSRSDRSQDPTLVCNPRGICKHTTDRIGYVGWP